MTSKDAMLYALAGDLARHAMGKTTRREGRRSETVWLADEDPLAWWCLVEAMVALPKRAARLQGGTGE